MATLTEWVIQQGHRAIGFIKGHPLHWSAHQREQAFRRTMARYNLPVREEWVLQGDYSPESGVRAAEQLLRQSELPTVVLAANDDMAMGFLQHCRTTDARWRLSSAVSSSSRCEEAYRASQRDKNGVCVLQSSGRVHANAERGLQSSERVHANAERGLQSGERVHANAERGLQSGERVHANAERAEQNFSNPLLQVPPAGRGNRPP